MSSQTQSGGSPSGTSFARLWAAALPRAQPKVGHASDQHQARMCVCTTQTCSQGATTRRSSDGSTIPHLSQAGYKQARDQQVTRSFPSQPTYEGLNQVIQSTTVTALIQPTKQSERRPASPEGPASCPLRFAILGLPWFKNCAKTGAVILGSCMQAARTQEA